MDSWDGSYKDLQELVGATGLRGEWKECGNGQYQFRAKSGAILNWWEQRGTVTFQGPTDRARQLHEALEQHSKYEENQPHASPKASASASTRPRVFVVHGHDATAREQLEWLLMKLDLEPYVLQNTAGGGKTIIEALEQQIGKTPEAEFGIVLMTPDDLGYARQGTSDDAQHRARQNVILEMGMLLSSLTRNRVAILVKGHVEKPTDIAGILYIPFNEHVKETLPKLAQHLRQAGFNVDTTRVA